MYTIESSMERLVSNKITVWLFFFSVFFFIIVNERARRRRNSKLVGPARSRWFTFSFAFDFGCVATGAGVGVVAGVSAFSELGAGRLVTNTKRQSSSSQISSLHIALRLSGRLLALMMFVHVVSIDGWGWPGSEAFMQGLMCTDSRGSPFSRHSLGNRTVFIKRTGAALASDVVQSKCIPHTREVLETFQSRIRAQLVQERLNNHTNRIRVDDSRRILHVSNVFYVEMNELVDFLNL